jgi:hypothetical protein
MASFLHDIRDPGANWCPDCQEPRSVCQCTKEVWPISLHMESRMVVMVNRDGVEQMPVIRGSYAHRIQKSNGYTEKKS